jgi:hypothetical protein
MFAQVPPGEKNQVEAPNGVMPVATRGQRTRDAELFSPNDVALRWSRVYKAVRSLVHACWSPPPPPPGPLLS